jgi:hypothetical protein
MDTSEFRAAWTTPQLLSLYVSLDTAISTGSGADGSVYATPPT